MMRLRNMDRLVTKSPLNKIVSKTGWVLFMLIIVGVALYFSTSIKPMISKIPYVGKLFGSSDSPAAV